MAVSMNYLIYLACSGVVSDQFRSPIELEGERNQQTKMKL